MSPRSFFSPFLLVAILFVACTGPTNPENEPQPVVTTSPTPSVSPPASDSTVSCRGLQVRTNKEVNTFLDRENGLLEFSYYVAKLQQDRSVTIRYRDDPWCRRNPETLRLIQHVGAGKEILGCLELPAEPAEGMTRVELFFFDRHDRRGLGTMVLVERDIPTQDEIARAAIEAWIDGPTPEEKKVGALPTAPENTELLGIDVDGTTAIVDMSRDFERTQLGTSYEGTVLAAVGGIATQFDPIDKGLLKIEGEFKDAYMGHGYVVDKEHPLVRPGKKRYRVAPTC